MEFMKLMHAVTGSLLIAIVPLAAHADELDYSYVNVEWANVDPDDAPSGDGFGVRGSIGFAEHYFAFAEYSSFDIDVVDIGLAAIGLGGHVGLTDNLDFVGRAGYVEVDIEVPGFSDTQDGWLVSAGLRGRVAERLDLEGSVMQRDLGDGGDDTVLTLGGRYHFTKRVSAALEYQAGDDVTMFYSGVRLSF
jgi:hypothetical protein